jgi:hypothetical protein
MKAAGMLECPKCGAPVAELARACPFCNVPLTPTEAVIEEDRQAQQMKRAAFTEALVKMMEKGTPARDALLAASAAHLDDPLSDALMNATLGIAKTFAASTKCTIDGNSLARILEAYQRLRPEVVSQGSAQLNLPFLAVGSTGPAQLDMKLTTASIADLER